MRKGKRLLWQLFVPFMAIVVLSLLVTAVFASYSFKKSYIKQITDDLRVRGLLAWQLLDNAVLKGENIEKACRETGQLISTRITAVLPDGNVLCDSRKEPGEMKSHADRREIQAALSGEIGVDIHLSREIGQRMLYVAIPATDENGKIKWAIRTAMPLSNVEAALNEMYARVAAGGLVIAFIAVFLSMRVARNISRPVEEVKSGAERYARGDFEYRLRIQGAREIGDLAETLNKMALQLMRLDNLRRDFVANVSHELMTPLTNIKGFVETLKDGAVNDPKKSREFLEIISRHADRLGTIVDDLLNISRIEQGVEGGHIIFEEGGVLKVVREAIRACEGKAEEKNIKIELSGTDDKNINMNPALLEGAIVNLVDNAIKYSAKGEGILLKVGSEGNEVFIKVIDKGCGIPQEHFHRIFERFYTVDKSRSRELGGTGLGLAIVKHIVSAHHGRIEVKSKPGEGSAFSIYLPVS